jgi:hypothetical protein
MKKIMILCLTIVLILTSTPVLAADDDGFIIIMDIVIARPFGLASLVIGSAFFVVTLPFAAMSKSTHKTADTLVGEPFRFTFIRPPGDFSDTYMVNREEEVSEPQHQVKETLGEEEKKPQDTESSQ